MINKFQNVLKIFTLPENFFQEHCVYCCHVETWALYFGLALLNYVYVLVKEHSAICKAFTIVLFTYKNYFGSMFEYHKILFMKQV